MKHGNKKLQTSQQQASQQLCAFQQKGSCKKGAECNFSHDGPAGEAARPEAKSGGIPRAAAAAIASPAGAAAQPEAEGGGSPKAAAAIIASKAEAGDERLGVLAQVATKPAEQTEANAEDDSD